MGDVTPDPVSKAQRDRDAAVKLHGWGSDEVRAASSRLLQAERDVAARDGMPYAVPFDLGIKWDTGAPMPVLISGFKTFVAFYLPPDFDFDGTNPRSRTTDDEDMIGVVEFDGMTAVKMGSPNDEALSGHPLWGRGLTYYSAHLVENSTWVRELMDINRVHAQFDESRWRDTRHYVFTFHDETLECVARSHDVTVTPGSLRSVAASLAEAAHV